MYTVHDIHTYMTYIHTYRQTDLYIHTYIHTYFLTYYFATLLRNTPGAMLKFGIYEQIKTALVSCLERPLTSPELFGAGVCVCVVCVCVCVFFVCVCVCVCVRAYVGM